MKVTATRPTYVETAEGKRLLKKGESADVDGRRYRGHPFVSAGYLVAEEEPKAKPGRKAKAEPAQHESEPQAEE